VVVAGTKHANASCHTDCGLSFLSLDKSFMFLAWGLL
jgi:hypothetical protein